MSRCLECRVDVRGDWRRCPLCGAPLQVAQGAGPDPWPVIPLRFDSRQVLRVLTGVSVLIIGAALVALAIFPAPFQGLRLVEFGLVTLWLFVLIAVRKRRNVAKSIVYITVVSSLLSAYSDYLDGWRGWSTTYAIPIVCSASIVALLIAVRIARMRPGDYIVYSWLTILMGVVPGLFVALGWVTESLPSWISVGLSVLMLIAMQVFRGAEIQHELGKRLNV